jgi:hypothetical protein
MLVLSALGLIAISFLAPDVFQRILEALRQLRDALFPSMMLSLI